MITRLHTAVWILLLAGFPGLASPPGTDTIHLGEVKIIHAMPVHRTAVISAHMDTLSMELVAGRNLSELLAFQPAIHIKSAGRGALSTASFRGTDASHTKVYWNGIRMNSPMLGQVDFSLIPVWFVDGLSLLYGGSSLAEGSGGFGGAVLLENSEEWNSSFDLSLNQELASFGTIGTYGRLSAGDDKIHSTTRVFWHHSRNDYPYMNTDILPRQEQRLTRAAYGQGGVLQEVSLRPVPRHELSLRLWYQEAERDLPPLMSQEGASREEGQEDRNLRTSMEWKGYPGFGSILVRSAYAGSRMHYYLHHTELDYRQFDSKSRENSLYNTLQADFHRAGRTRIRVRADLNRHDVGIRDQIRSQGYAHLRNEGSLSAGIYREAGKRWILYGLVRQEWADGTWLPLMPSAGFKCRLFLDSPLSLKGNLSRNYNLPSLNDLYWIPGGNPDLRPENSVNGDLSIDFERNRERLAIRGSLNAFAAWVEDWILWKPTRFRYWEAENLARVFSRGFDVRLGSDVRVGEYLLSMRASYAFTRSTNEEAIAANDLSRGKQLIYIPVHASHACMNFTGKGYFINCSVRFTGSRYTQPSSQEQDFTEILNSYTLLDLSIGKSWKIGPCGAGIRLTGYNLLNVSYQAVRSRPMPMRNYALTLSLEI